MTHQPTPIAPAEAEGAQGDGLEEFAQIAGSKPISNDYGGIEKSNSQVLSRLSCFLNETPAYFPCGPVVERLDAGVYSIEEHNNRGIFFTRMDIKLDNLMVLPDMNCERVLDDIKHFWDSEPKFRKVGLLWKRGILLWGPPGSGKTSLLNLLSKEIVARNGVAMFTNNPHRAAHGLEMFRKIDPTRSLVVILEDIDAIIKDWGESALLALLDGEVQIDNVVYIATTNYPELLDKRIVNRPSRFDEIIKIDMPTALARKIYLKNKVERFNTQEGQIELDEWVTGTKGMSIAHLRELVAAVECLGKDFGAVIERLGKMNKAKLSSDQNERKTVGFVDLDDDD